MKHLIRKYYREIEKNIFPIRSIAGINTSYNVFKQVINHNIELSYWIQQSNALFYFCCILESPWWHKIGSMNAI